MRILIILMSLVGISSSCSKRASTHQEATCLSSGDILVSNSASDVVLVLHADGSYKDIGFNVLNSAETVYGLGWNEKTQEVLINVDGADRVVALSAKDCSSRVLISDSNLTGNLRGITRLASGDFLIVETNSTERFTENGYRIATGGWPKNLQTAGSQIEANSAGGFVLCSTGTDVVRTYDDSGTQVSTKSSGIAGTTDAAGCKYLSDGSIATVWSGTTDTVAIYSSDLTTSLATFSDTNLLSSPGGMAQRPNGNLLIVDRILNWIVEVDLAGNYVATIGDGVLSTPEFIFVVP